LRVTGICPPSPIRGSVVLYRVTHVQTLLPLEPSFGGPPGTFADRPICAPSRDASIGSTRAYHRWRNLFTSSHASNRVSSRSMACIISASQNSDKPASIAVVTSCRRSASGPPVDQNCRAKQQLNQVVVCALVMHLPSATYVYGRAASPAHPRECTFRA
jgi:hypothetical protein